MIPAIPAAVLTLSTPSFAPQKMFPRISALPTIVFPAMAASPLFRNVRLGAVVSVVFHIPKRIAESFTAVPSTWNSAETPAWPTEFTCAVCPMTSPKPFATRKSPPEKVREFAAWVMVMSAELKSIFAPDPKKRSDARVIPDALRCPILVPRYPKSSRVFAASQFQPFLIELVPQVGIFIS